jgi:uncharacterized protein (TIGR03118 family)
VFNGNASAFHGDLFIFVTEDGTIAGWQPSAGGTATLRVDNSPSGAVYKGVTIATDASGAPRLYATNFHAGTIDAYDGSYAPLNLPGHFTDPGLPSGFAPFNVQMINNNLIVTYAKQNAMQHDDVAGAGNGYVDLFDVNGVFMTRLVSNGPLNSPWGVALAPSNFASAPNRLLIGNFGDGVVNVFNYSASNPTSATATFEGSLRNSAGVPMVIDGLWALQFGPDAGSFASNVLYFTAGPQMEMHGVFGSLQTASLTSTAATGADIRHGGS